MKRAAQFAVVVAVVGAFVLGSAKAVPDPFGSEAMADRAAATLAKADAGARAAMAARSGTPQVCFAGRPCPGAHLATCFATTSECAKAEVTYRFAERR